jgi:hypothetical protein
MTIYNTSDDWIYKVRDDIYEKTKNMSLDEYQEYFRIRGEEIAKQYGFTISKPLNRSSHANSYQKCYVKTRRLV